MAIACGDHSGIGPEVTLKAVRALLDEGVGARFRLFGDRLRLSQLDLALGTRLDLDRALANGPQIEVIDPRPAPLPTQSPAGDATTAVAALEYLRHAAKDCLARRSDALVTAPLSKEAILRARLPFIGQTEFLAGLANEPNPVMMLLGTDDRQRWLRVALATTHLPLRKVAEQLTSGHVEFAIRRAAAACQQLGLPRARIGVCGVNPHAGEGGLLGDEEIHVVAPAIEAARQARIDAVGALPADTLFYQALRGDFDAVVAMYHDQGLAPLKMIAFETGVNWTLGLPFIRTSPDHGTAFDIAGTGKASPSSMIAAIALALRLASPEPTTAEKSGLAHKIGAAPGKF